MIDDGVLAVEPWAVTERGLHLDLLPQTESIFALSNGHIGIRGNLDEGEPHAVPGTYLNGFFESVPLPHAEAGYGYPEVGQSLIDVTDGKLMRLLVDDEPFDVRYGTVEHHERSLDLRDGVLRREVRWTSPAGQGVAVRTTRLVSFVQRSVVAIRYEVEPLGEPARIVLQSVLSANQPTGEEERDPRAAAALRAPLVGEYHTHHDLEAALGHHTRRSGLRMSATMDHVVEGPEGTVTDAESEPDLARVTVSTELEPGERLVVVKFVAYGWSSGRSTAAVRDQVDAAAAAAKRTGWDGLVAGQREYLESVWDGADVEVEGDDELQQAVRYAVFQVVQAGARAEQQAIPAKGLTGRGYDGHTFWDMDTYVVPALTYLAPRAARDALLWRHSTLELAKARAAELRLSGAAFPWRTIRGEECSGYWPAGTAAFHVDADIADAARRYVLATGDEEFEHGPGIELQVWTARLWASLGHFDTEGSFRIDGVTGPDEYTALVDNNVFTNVMAARNLRTAADLVERHPDRAADLQVGADEVATWRRAAASIVIPYDEALGVTAQSEGFTRYRKWDFESLRPEQHPLLMHFPYYTLYSSQVVKQADLVFALYMCGDCFDDEQKRRDFDYYEAITVRDSSLSASVQGIVAAEVGYLDLAYRYFRETALIDLRDTAGNTDDGLHLASLAGAWLMVAAGFGGMRDHGDDLCFAPQLPVQLDRLRFRLLHRGRRLVVDMDHDSTRYELRNGTGLDLRHHGRKVRVEPGVPLELPNEHRPSRPTPEGLAVPAGDPHPLRDDAPMPGGTVRPGP